MFSDGLLFRTAEIITKTPLFLYTSEKHSHLPAVSESCCAFLTGKKIPALSGFGLLWRATSVFSTVHLTFLFEKQVGMEFPTLNAARIVAEKQVCRNIFARSLFCSDGLFRLQSVHFILVKPYANACYLCF